MMMSNLAVESERADLRKITGDFTPGSITEACLAHGLLAGGKVHGFGEVHSFTSSGTDHLDSQCTSCTSISARST